MSNLVLIEAPVQPDKVAAMKSFLAEIVPATRSYDGCQEADVHFNVDDAGNMILVQQWDSRGHHEKYLQWRTETGVSFCFS